MLPCIVILLFFSPALNSGSFHEAQTFEGAIWDTDFFSIPSRDSYMCRLNKSLLPWTASDWWLFPCWFLKVSPRLSYNPWGKLQQPARVPCDLSSWLCWKWQMERLKGLSVTAGIWQLRRWAVSPPPWPSQPPDSTAAPVALWDSCGLKWHQSLRCVPYLHSCCFNDQSRSFCGPSRLWGEKVKQTQKSEGGGE